MAEFWCFNCQQTIEDDEVYRAHRHKDFLGKQMAVLQSFRNLKKQSIVCICQDCVFYRLQVCSCCKKAAPLCMYTLEEWFVSNSLYRKCLDCTALNETIHVSSSLPYQVPTSQFIQQCLRCSKFKYICSFVIFRHCYDENCCHRAIRDGNEKSDCSKNGSVCIECKLLIDIQEYKLFLKERYHFKISLEPTVGCSMKYSDSSPNLKSYANAVAGIVEKTLEKPISLVDMTSTKPYNGPVFVISTLKDFICNPVASSLKKSLKYLEDKVKLELKLSGMNVAFWQGVLKYNIESTTHAFSLQGTETTDFSGPETRWAYASVYTPVHASIVYDTVVSLNNEKVPSLISWWNPDESVEVCCFGAALGSEAIGLQHFLPKETTFHLFDNCLSWEHNAKDLLGEELGISFTFTAFDVTKKIFPSVLEKVKKAKIFTFVKFLSAVQNLSDAVSALRAILQAAPAGSSFLFIDNSMMSIKNFVESLVFPSRDFEETKNGKENATYVFNASYAEYRFEIEDAISKQPLICDYINLVADWVGRPPLSDLRVYIFHVVKKGLTS